MLGVRVNAVQIPDVARMEGWIARREGCRYIAVTGMHGVTEAQHKAGFNEILDEAGMVVKLSPSECAGTSGKTLGCPQVWTASTTYMVHGVLGMVGERRLRRQSVGK